MEEDKAEDTVKIPPAKPSPALSWVSLGFVVGALFILTLPRHAPPPAVTAPPPAPAPAPAPALAPPQLTTIEAVFAEWGKYAVWDEDTTEVALWNAQTNTYADCFEVLRSGGNLYFRSIPHLTRPLLTHGVPANPPLEYTETEEQRAEWLGQKNQAELRAFGNAILTGHP